MRWKTDTVTGWGRVLSAASEIARPERTSALNAILASENAPAMGNRRSYGDAPLNDGGKSIDMTRLDRILGFDESTGILEAEAGCQLGELTRLFAPKGWLPAVLPGTGFATIGGAIAMDVHGKNHHNAGSFGQHVEAITLLVQGEKKTISPKRNASLFKATVGGMGQTGIILSAKIKMLPCKGDVIMVTERRVDGLDEFLELLDNSSATYTVGWIDATAKGSALGRGILEEGETGSGLVPARSKSKSVPFNAPSFALSPLTVRLFNKLYFRRVPDHGRTSVKPITDFFFPLDRIYDWNRLYGKRGFHQFQCVVPVAEAATLREILTQIAHSGLASPLAVLKRMGAGSAGYMSFPMEGYTLAVDFPNTEAARALVPRLEKLTAEVGGRIYLAKDSLSSGERIRPMYPDHATWSAEAAKADPTGALKTDLIRRLDLRSTK
ncbi:FAD-binding protein [Falsihalocynthiibacter sp. SS001]|uniref:FAD-binding oxidoreductase n=1 Tax=Falsihalocynthiibacter sp. SS001 TaxID=3349698 RepID=UPI0036D3FC0D